MKIAYCERCGKETTFKKSFGFGTFLGILMTLGLWLVTIPLYTLRCTECGSELRRPMLRTR